MLALACVLCMAIGDGASQTGTRHEEGQPPVAVKDSEIAREVSSPANPDRHGGQSHLSSDQLAKPQTADGLLFPGEERHLRNIRQRAFEARRRRQKRLRVGMAGIAQHFVGRASFPTTAICRTAASTSRGATGSAAVARRARSCGA